MNKGTRFTYVSAAFLWIATATATQADISVYASRWMAQGYDSANGVGGRLSLSIMPTLRADIGAGKYQDFDDDDKIMKLSVTPLEAGLSFHAPLGLYAGAGVGYYLIDAKSERAGVDVESDNKMGCYAMAGWSMGIPYISVFAECKYTYVDASVTVDGYRPEVNDKDDKLNGLVFSAGLTFKF